MIVIIAVDPFWQRGALTVTLPDFGKALALTGPKAKQARSADVRSIESELRRLRIVIAAMLVEVMEVNEEA